MLHTAVVLLWLAPVQSTPQTMKIAVFDFATAGLAAEEALGLGQSLANIVATEVQALGYAVISSADLNALLSLEKQKDLLGCQDDTSCLAEIGGALGVELMVAGTVGKLGDSYTLTLTLIDTRRTEARQRFQGEAGSIGVLGNTARRGVAVLFEKTVDLKGTGMLVVRTEPPGAEVFVDGKPAGVSPATIDDLPAGDHLVTARQHALQGRLDVRVRTGAVERVTVVLRAGPGVTVKILSTPPDAAVFVDGVASGVTPLVVADLAGGEHTVRLEAPGFLPLEQTIALSREEYEKGGEVPLKVELALHEHVTLIGVPVGASLGTAVDAGELSEGISLVAELFIEPLPWLEVGLGFNTPAVGLFTVRLLPWHGAFELGLLARFAGFAESPTLRDGSFALGGGLCAGAFTEVGLGELGARVEVLVNRELKPVRTDLFTFPATIGLAWRI